MLGDNGKSCFGIRLGNLSDGFVGDPKLGGRLFIPSRSWLPEALNDKRPKIVDVEQNRPFEVLGQRAGNGRFPHAGRASDEKNCPSFGGRHLPKYTKCALADRPMAGQLFLVQLI